jgi:hypothetical protein
VFRSGRDQAEVSALWARVLHAFGHGVFDSQVNISTGRAVARTGPVALLRRLHVLPQIRHISSFEPVDRQIEILRTSQAHTFSSYAISLELIADALLEHGITDIRPKLVFSAAMALSDRGRTVATKAFGVAPLEVYVAAELGTIGWECPEEPGVLHLNDDMQIVEILDHHDQPVPDGETGQVPESTAEPMRSSSSGARQRCRCSSSTTAPSAWSPRTTSAVRPARWRKRHCARGSGPSTGLRRSDQPVSARCGTPPSRTTGATPDAGAAAPCSAASASRPSRCGERSGASGRTRRR